MVQGLPSTLRGDDMHVTLAFSRKPVDWHKLKPDKENITVRGGDRSVGPLGRALVLHFEHPELTSRWQEFCDAGATWDHPSYQPHLTLTYSGDKDDIEPYSGPLIFGPEKFAPLDEDWDQSIEEIPLIAQKHGVLASKSLRHVKYAESITENTRMTELSSLLIKNIDLILEAYNVDEAGNLVVANTKKVREADEVFHQYFVKSMNNMFRQINEADPIMHDPNGMGMSPHGIDDLGMGGHEMMGDMAMGHHGHDDGMGMGMGEEPTGEHPMHMGGMMGDMGHGMEPGMDHGMGHGMDDMHMGHMGESAEYDWLFNEEAELDVDALFDLTEDDEQLDELMMDPDHQDEMGGMGGPMDHDAGANDMGGMGDQMDLDSGADHHDMGGGEDDGDMVTVHGTTDEGGEFEFSFDPNTLGFGDMGGDMGGMGEEDDGMGDMGHGHEEHHDEHGSHGIDHMNEPGMGPDEDDDQQIGEAMVKKGKPGKGPRGAKSSRMGVVPADPAVNHAAPFPTPQGAKQKRK